MTSAEAALHHRLALDANDVEARSALFRIAFAQDRFSEAIDHLRAFPAAMHGDFQWIAHHADLLGKLGEHEREIELLDALLTMEPSNAGPLVSKANALKTLGRTDEAIIALRAAIVVRPTYGRPWWLLSDLKSFRFDGADRAAMEQLLATDIAVDDRIPLHFALAKAFEDRGDAVRAFDHYADGNRLRAASLDPTASVPTRKVDRSIATFTAEFLAVRRGWGSPTTAPIFIVGMPRSGSTLVEQILASHPLIEGTAELPLIPFLNREIAADPSLPPGDLFSRIASLDAARHLALGELYLDRAQAFRRTDRPFFIDKLPANWTNIGLIRLILPAAKIIDARRHPMATGFSNFRQNYGAGAAFSFDLTSMGRYYCEYLRLVRHFERVDPGAIHRVVNETLIDDFEPEVRRLLNFVGVEFDPACLDFHRNRRAVATPSAEQVRRPINRDGVDQWRGVESMLEPLKQALGTALDDWNLPPGAGLDDHG